MTIIRAAVENAHRLNAEEATTVEKLAHALNLPSVGNDFTLDTAERFLREAVVNLVDYKVLARVSDWHVHRGGHHVALSRIGAPTERVLLVTEAPVEDSRCWHCGDVVGNPAAHADCGVEEPLTDLDPEVEDLINDPATAQAQAAADDDRFDRVNGYIAAFTDREGRSYAAAYAHALDTYTGNCDNDGRYTFAYEQAASRGVGLTTSRRATIRRGVLAARLDPKPGWNDWKALPAYIQSVKDKAEAQTPPVAAQEAAGATTAPAEASLPAIVSVPGDGLRDSWDTFTKSYQPVPDKARLDALVEAVTAERPTDLDALRAKVRKLFPRWVIEREPGYFTLAQSKRHLPALVFSQALTAAEAGIEPGHALNVWVNQGSREATVLATIGRRYLVEYTMPKGTTALQVFTVGIQGGQTVSYRTINGQWLKAIVDAGQDWLCHPQSSFNQSAADLLASRKAVR